MTDSSLEVALIQTDLYWEDKTANLAALEEKVASLSKSVDVIVLPEMFNTGFSMENRDIAELPDMITTKWMKQIAAQYDALTVGSFSVREGELLFNRLLAVFPDGTFQSYDKRHLFRMGGEHAFYSGGEKPVVVEWKGWKIRPLICYDLRFPVWSRATTEHPFDLLLYVANWPESRRLVWNTLLKARAIENLSYVVGVNRIGTDGKGTRHSGDSQAIDYMGRELIHLGESETNELISLSKEELLEFRQKFPAHLDADRFDII